MDRFWSKVDEAGPDECWEWQASTKEFGYGQIGVDGEVRLAHRVAVELDGRDPEGLCVLHECDNPSCVNPAHLYLGDRADNADDARNRGSIGGAVSAGGDNGNSRLTASEVRELRRKYNETDVSQRALAEKYEVSQSAVRDIVNGRTWAWLE